MADTLTVNGTDYQLPERPTVVVCIDSKDSRYIEHGMAAGMIPNIAGWIRDGFYTMADGSMPSFICPKSSPSSPGVPRRHTASRATAIWTWRKRTRGLDRAQTAAGQLGDECFLAPRRTGSLGHGQGQALSSAPEG